MPNRLIHETSPYLLQHAHNPVDWYAWGAEAFERAKQEQKPILVSIGYATCHWCHVMERESFEDARVAAYMNAHFINIKVDREERPDVDNIYMEVVQLISGNGGWPLNCFLLPDGRAFFAGTYFPPKNAYGRASWSQVLANIQTAFANRRHETIEQAEVIMGYLQKSTQNFVRPITDLAQVETPFTPALLENIYYRLRENFDRLDGGFGGSPKFPATMSLRYCLQYAQISQYSSEAMAQVCLSLDKMVLGGIYDQIGGGFARYSVDSIWFVPHFEKMLYDNALLIGILADAYAVTKSDLYRQTIAQTAQWLQRDMLSQSGGYFSALDADSEGKEGKYYLFTQAEISEILPADLAELCIDFYGITPHGNWEETNILYRRTTAHDYATSRQLDPAQVAAQLSDIENKLLSVRAQRVPPSLDDKILLDWNALLVVAFAKAFHALGEEAYRQKALDLMAFLTHTFEQPQADGRMWHSYKENTSAKIEAFLDDYAYYIDALISAYGLSFDKSYLDKAAAVADFVLAEFWDEKEHNFYFTAQNSREALVLRPKDLYDNATPSGNAVMIENLQRLSHLVGNAVYAERATQALLTMVESIEKYPQSFARWATASLHATKTYKEYAIVGKNALAFAAEIQRATAAQSAIVVVSATGAQDLPLLENRTAPANETLIFVCIHNACQAPVNSVAEALKI